MPANIDISSPIAVLELDNPGRHNALNAEMITAIQTALDTVEGDHQGPVLRIKGNGPSFCSGFDLDEIEGDRPLLDQFLVGLSGISKRLRRMEKVVVAQVHGSALAGGCALLSACDLGCVAPDARIGYPVHQIGISPAVSIPTLASAIGNNRASELMLSGRIINGREAHRMGLAHHLAESDDALPELVDQVCKGWNALAVTKDWINRILGSDADEPFEQTLQASIETGRSDEATRMLSVYWSRSKK
jgi:methylglutaconyl-CoA hydratase